MVVACHTYTLMPKSMMNKVLDFDSDAIKCMLLSSYTVGSTQNTAQFVSDVLAAPAVEATGTAYVAGGTAVTLSVTNSGLVFTVASTNPVWNASTITASFALFYDSTPGTNATNPVICYWDFGGPVSSTGAAFTLTVAGTGLVTFTGS